LRKAEVRVLKHGQCNKINRKYIQPHGIGVTTPITNLLAAKHAKAAKKANQLILINIDNRFALFA